MKDALGVANYFVPTAYDAENTPPGMVSDAENLRTWSPAEEEALTRQQIATGRVENVTADAITPDRNSQLNDEQARFLARMKRAREHGDMLSMHDCDILIQIIEELSKCKTNA